MASPATPVLGDESLLAAIYQATIVLSSAATPGKDVDCLRIPAEELSPLLSRFAQSSPAAATEVDTGGVAQVLTMCLSKLESPLLALTRDLESALAAGPEALVPALHKQLAKAPSQGHHATLRSLVQLVSMLSSSAGGNFWEGLSALSRTFGPLVVKGGKHSNVEGAPSAILSALVEHRSVLFPEVTSFQLSSPTLSVDTPVVRAHILAHHVGATPSTPWCYEPRVQSFRVFPAPGSTLSGWGGEDGMSDINSSPERGGSRARGTKGEDGARQGGHGKRSGKGKRKPLGASNGRGPSASRAVEETASSKENGGGRRGPGRRGEGGGGGWSPRTAARMHSGPGSAQSVEIVVSPQKWHHGSGAARRPGGSMGVNSPVFPGSGGAPAGGGIRREHVELWFHRMGGALASEVVGAMKTQQAAHAARTREEMEALLRRELVLHQAQTVGQVAALVEEQGQAQAQAVGELFAKQRAEVRAEVETTLEASREASQADLVKAAAQQEVVVRRAAEASAESLGKVAAQQEALAGAVSAVAARLEEQRVEHSQQQGGVVSALESVGAAAARIEQISWDVAGTADELRRQRAAGGAPPKHAGGVIVARATAVPEGGVAALPGTVKKVGFGGATSAPAPPVTLDGRGAAAAAAAAGRRGLGSWLRRQWARKGMARPLLLVLASALLSAIPSDIGGAPRWKKKSREPIKFKIPFKIPCEA